MKDRCQEVEESIARLEAGIGECETGLQVFVSAAETARLTDLLAARRQELEILVAEWAELSESLEAATLPDEAGELR